MMDKTIKDSASKTGKFDRDELASEPRSKREEPAQPHTLPEIPSEPSTGMYKITSEGTDTAEREDHHHRQ
ncbi:MAG: hypothetical protein ACOYLB_12835 [Phototrophicaceae bacterium]